MFTKILNCLICTGLIGLSTVNAVQAKPCRFYPNSNPGVHRTLIIPNNGRYNQISPVVPRRSSSYYNSYYPGYYNPYYLRPVRPNQKIIINRDRNNNRNYQNNRYQRRYNQNRGYSSPYGDSGRPSYLYYRKNY